MSENPFESPTTESQAVGVLSGKREDVKLVARYQKGVLVSLLIQVIAFVGFNVVTSELKGLLGLVVIICLIIGAVFTFKLAIKIYSTGIGVLLGILTLIPYLGLLVLLTINGKATETLRKNGIKVGFLGAKLSDI